MWRIAPDYSLPVCKDMNQDRQPTFTQCLSYTGLCSYPENILMSTVCQALCCALFIIRLKHIINSKQTHMQSLVLASPFKTLYFSYHTQMLI